MERRKNLMGTLQKTNLEYSAEILNRVKGGKLSDYMYICRTCTMLEAIDTITLLAIDCTDEISTHGENRRVADRISGFLYQISSLAQTVHERLQIDEFADIEQLSNY
jgi:hypothetical protein